MLARILIPAFAILCCSHLVTSPFALLLGIFTALIFGNPYLGLTGRLIHYFLALSIIGLGAGIDLHVIQEIGLHGLFITVVSISSIMFLGFVLGKSLGSSRDVSLLISVGTAICGGSAIAAVAPVLRAKSADVSISLCVVFLLNSLALVIFPTVGGLLNLTQEQFGLWSALAIHDTSSVIGAAAQYGPKALEVGTVTKLVRALWIVPVAFIIGILVKPESKSDVHIKAKKPWFILGFVIASAMVTWIPDIKESGLIISGISKRLLVVTLFLIGSSITKESLRAVGSKSLIQGSILWLISSISILSLILFGLN